MGAPPAFVAPLLSSRAPKLFTVGSRQHRCHPQQLQRSQCAAAHLLSQHNQLLRLRCPVQLAIVQARDGRVLLGRKKKGFGEGYYNGFGGKVHQQRAPAACATGPPPLITVARALCAACRAAARSSRVRASARPRNGRCGQLLVAGSRHASARSHTCAAGSLPLAAAGGGWRHRARPAAARRADVCIRRPAAALGGARCAHSPHTTAAILQMCARAQMLLAPSPALAAAPAEGAGGCASPCLQPL